MAVFCTECGREVPGGAAHCPECGTPVAGQQAAPVQQPVQQPKKKAEVQPVAGAPVSTGYFFGMMFVYALPIIGWIACIVTTIKSRDLTKKHFAKAMLIWLIIGLIISLIMGAVVTWWTTMLINALNDLAASELGAYEDIGSVEELLMLLEQ